MDLLGMLVYILMAMETLAIGDKRNRNRQSQTKRVSNRKKEPRYEMETKTPTDDKPDLGHKKKSVEDTVNDLLQRRVYAKSDPPRFDKPTKVELGIYVNSFYSISEQTMDYMVSMYLRQQWQDSRLQFEPVNGKISKIRLGEDSWEKLWVPDTFFRNEKGANFHEVTVQNRLMTLNSSGFLWYVTKISATLSCPMKLQKYPLDTQHCPMMFESFGYTMDTMYFAWLPSPVEIDTNVQLPQFTLKDNILYDCSQNYTAGAFPCLQITFILSRDIGFFVIQVYMPTVLIVILSWVSFWISVDAIPARVSLGLLTVLTMTTMSTGANSTLPRVSYIKAIDVWMSMCLVFVFAALLEFALVNVISRKGAFPCLEIQFVFNREIGFFLIQLYIPTMLIVILSWVSFWINVEATPARVSLGLLTVLTMTTQSAGARTSLPRVSYVKAIDVWFSMCLVFVFCSLLEFAVVNVVSRKHSKAKAKRLPPPPPVRNRDLEQACPLDQINLPVRNGTERQATPGVPIVEGKNQARRIDKVSRKMFPMAFLLFNIVYWIIYTLPGAFPCLEIQFVLHRQIGFFLIQIYVPTFMIVILSWVSFWINIDAIPARVSLGLVTVLTMTTQSSGANQALPRVSYVKAIDIWFSMCLVFVFTSLLEFAVVNVISRKQFKAKAKRLQLPPPVRNRDLEQACPLDQINIVENGRERRDPAAAKAAAEDGKSKARQIDKMSRKAFPMAFLLFNIVYWIIYTLPSEGPESLG